VGAEINEYDTNTQIIQGEQIMPDTSYILQCPSCGKGNRIPADKEGFRGRCGNCKNSLPPLYSWPQQLDDHTFDEFVRSYPGPVLTEFWAPW